MPRCDLLLFGATRNTGYLLAEQACARGESVAAMVRPGSDASRLKALGVKIVEGDAFNLPDCENAVRETSPRRVVSVMGGKNPQGRRVDAEGNINVIRALENEGSVERFVLMTSMGCGEQYEGMSESAKKFLGEALRAKTEAENVLQDSPLPWSIVRPGGLSNDPPSGDFSLLLEADRQRSGYVTRADVAAATLTVLDDERWLRRVATVQRKTESEGWDAA